MTGDSEFLNAETIFIAHNFHTPFSVHFIVHLTRFEASLFKGLSTWYIEYAKFSVIQFHQGQTSCSSHPQNCSTPWIDHPLRSEPILDKLAQNCPWQVKHPALEYF